MHTVMFFQSVETGNVAHALISPETIARIQSRGIESVQHIIESFLSETVATIGIISIIDAPTKEQYFIQDDAGVVGRIYFMELSYGQAF